MTSLVPVLQASGEPLHRQIYTSLRASILNGTLRAGDPLPSTRDLALELGVSRNTTNAAYEQLLAEGYAISRPGARTLVAEGLALPKPVPSGVSLSLSRFGEAALQAGIQSPSRKGAPLRYDFVYGRGAVEAFPFETWRRILSRQARNATIRTLDYGSAAGDKTLREAIAAHLRRSRAVVCDPSQILILNGSQQGLDLAARVLLDPGDPVIVEDPTYQGARDVFRAAGANLQPVPVDTHGLQVAQFPARAKLIFTTPSHQFPTGVVLTPQRRRQILDWARRHSAAILEDDYDGEFHYAGQPVESMQSMDTEGRVLYLGTFSRTIFPALRIGYLVAPTTLVEPLLAAKWLTDRHTAVLEQRTLAEFIATGAYERHLRKLRKRNATRLTVILDAIAKHLDVEVTGEKAGAHLCLWPRRRNFNEAEAVQAAAARNVGIYGIRDYYAGKSKRGGILLGFSRMNERDIREGIRRLADLL